MSKMSQQDQLSYFQVGGIHGLPYVQWNGSGGTKPQPRSWGGYCTHGSVLFPTWHRPYILLLEVRALLLGCIIIFTYLP